MTDTPAAFPAQMDLSEGERLLDAVCDAYGDLAGAIEFEGAGDQPSIPKAQKSVVRAADALRDHLRLALSAARERDALREALQKIASQKMVEAIGPDDFENGDFEGAYDTMIGVARTALAMNREQSEGETPINGEQK
jgi:hypothetical protein